MHEIYSCGNTKIQRQQYLENEMLIKSSTSFIHVSILSHVKKNIEISIKTFSVPKISTM